MPAHVLPFGSDGGGAWFVLERATGRVLRLGYWRYAPGPTHLLAEDFAGFLERLQWDLRAFVTDERDHPYLT